MQQKKNSLVGFVGNNIKGLEYTVTEELYHKPGEHRNYKVKFTETGGENVANDRSIKSGAVRDFMHPNLFNIGYIGYTKEFYHEPMYKKAQTTWRNMMSRCYNKNNCKDYSSYGAIGVTVDEKWHCFANFYKDIKTLPGFNEELFISGKITLDKDLYQIDIPHSMRKYSSETCAFIPIEKNIKLRDTKKYSVHFFAKKDGIEYEVYGIVNFCKEHNLSEKCVKDRLTGRLKYPYHGWTFRYADVTTRE